MKVKNIVVMDNGMKIFGEDDDGKPLTLTYNGEVRVTFTVNSTGAFAGVRVQSRSGGPSSKLSNHRFDAH